VHEGGLRLHQTATTDAREDRFIGGLMVAQPDSAAAGRDERGRATGDPARRRTEEGERVGPAPPAAGGTSAAAAGSARRKQRKNGPIPPAAGGTSEVAAAARSEKGSRADRSAPPAAGGPVRRRRTSPSGPRQRRAHTTGGWRDQCCGSEQACAGEQTRQTRPAGGWRDQRGSGGQVREIRT
jgi:hypothetical protein